MKLIAGLGNPGESYRRTRHNIGFMVLDELSRRFGAGTYKQRFHAEVSEVARHGEKMFLIKPQTYMNRSGQSVSELAQYYKIDLTDILVVHDDKDISFGEVRIAEGGRDAGHKGIRSIITHLGQGDFIRIRIGVGSPRHGEDTADFVLSSFYDDELSHLETIVQVGADAVQAVIRDGVAISSNAFNRKRWVEDSQGINS